MRTGSGTCHEKRTNDGRNDDDFGEVLRLSWFFIWIAAIMIWFRCIFDLFGDETLSGGKAGWWAGISCSSSCRGSVC